MELIVRNKVYSVAHFIVGHPKCGRLHGHSYSVTVTIQGRPYGEYGFVGGLDFQDLKNALDEIIGVLDHRVLVPGKGGKECGVEPTSTGVHVYAGKKTYVFPEEDVCVVPTESTTAEDMADYIRRELVRRLIDPINEEGQIQYVKVQLDEGPNQSCVVV